MDHTAGTQGPRGSISHGYRGAKGGSLVKARAGSGLLGGPASEWKNSRLCSLTPDSAHRRQLCVSK